MILMESRIFVLHHGVSEQCCEDFRCSPLAHAWNLTESSLVHRLLKQWLG